MHFLGASLSLRAGLRQSGMDLFSQLTQGSQIPVTLGYFQTCRTHRGTKFVAPIWNKSPLICSSNPPSRVAHIIAPLHFLLKLFKDYDKQRLMGRS